MGIEPPKGLMLESPVKQLIMAHNILIIELFFFLGGSQASSYPCLQLSCYITLTASLLFPK